MIFKLSKLIKVKFNLLRIKTENILFCCFLHSILVLGNHFYCEHSRLTSGVGSNTLNSPSVQQSWRLLQNRATRRRFRASLEFGPFPAKLSIITTNSKNRFSQTANHALIPGTSSKHDKLNLAFICNVSTVHWPKFINCNTQALTFAFTNQPH